MSVTIVDRRTDTLGKHPVWEVTLSQMTWASDNQVAVTQAVNINGIIKQIVIIVGTATDGTLVCPVEVQDSSGNVIKTFASLADATTHVKSSTTDFGENELAFDSSGFVISADPDKVPGASGLTVDIVVRGI